MKINERFQDNDYYFVPIKGRSKVPSVKTWSKKHSFKWWDEEITEHEGNVAILTGASELVVFDCDTQKAEDLARKLPQTLVVGTSTLGNGYRKKHFYFNCDLKEKKILKENGDHLGDVLAGNTLAILPGSIHKEGTPYEIIENNNIATLSTEQLMEVIKNYTQTIHKTIDTKKFFTSVGEGDRNNKTIQYATFLRQTGATKEEAMRMLVAWNMTNLIPPLPETELQSILESAYRNEEPYAYKFKPKGIVNTLENKMELFNDNYELVERLYEKQPFFYDRNKLWWFWNFDRKCWEKIDETDLLLNLDNALRRPKETIQSRMKQEILEGMRRVGRRNIPKNSNKTWIQYNGTIIDVENGKEFPSTPEYFVTNPIPWNIGRSTDTPTIDRLFKEWVGEEYVHFLYQIIAYCTLPSYPLHRLFCLIGSGLNGKGKFLHLLSIFLGSRNCTSSSLDHIVSAQNRFEKGRLYKKLLCTMGETNFGSMYQTDMLKRLTGGDLIPFEFKGKDPFDDYNYAKIVIATNSLPITHDKTVGFFRRWLIVDFPNTFTEKRDVLKEIPKTEFENLARKCIDIIKILLTEREFDKEGSVEDRTKKYEELSNPVLRFIQENCLRDINSRITKFEFTEALNHFLSENNYRQLTPHEVNKTLRMEGFDEKVVTKDQRSRRYILGLRWKKHESV